MRESKNNNLPVLYKNRKTQYRREDIVEDIDPLDMDFITYERILYAIKCRGLVTEKAKEFFVNRLIPHKPNLYFYFLKYESIYKKKIILKKRIELFDYLNETLIDMDNAKSNGIQLIKRGRKQKTKEEGNPIFEFLDLKIEEIEVMIYLCKSPKKICIELINLYPGKLRNLNPIIYERWQDQTEHIERLQFAFKKSADEHMYGAQEFLLEWLDKYKHPELNMQHVGIVREIALFRSRMAGFLNRKKFGNKVEIVDDRPQTKVLDGKDLKYLLNELNSSANKINGKEEEDTGEINMDEELEDEIEEKEEVESEGVIFSEFEEEIEDADFEEENKNE